MKDKAFQLGIMVGRFQTFHTGHKYMVDKACAICNKVGIFVGSSQESGTLKNPFNYETRKKMLKKVFGDKIEVYPLPDIGVGNNSRWGDYVLENVRRRFGKSPDLLISGKEERRIDWFDSAVGVTVAELYVPKIIEMSSTCMRNFFIEDNRSEWERYTPPELREDYEQLRDAVLAAKDNLFTDSI